MPRGPSLSLSLPLSLFFPSPSPSLSSGRRLSTFAAPERCHSLPPSCACPLPIPPPSSSSFRWPPVRRLLTHGCTPSLPRQRCPASDGNYSNGCASRCTLNLHERYIPAYIDRTGPRSSLPSFQSVPDVHHQEGSPLPAFRSVKPLFPLCQFSSGLEDWEADVSSMKK